MSESINNSILELWDFCKKELLSGGYDQIILDEVFLAIEMNIIGKDDLISTLENRLITGDVILTGTSIPKIFLLMADQITELRS
jgi:cob(I)alamin adenosyltransferase